MIDLFPLDIDDLREPVAPVATQQKPTADKLPGIKPFTAYGEADFDEEWCYRIVNAAGETVTGPSPWHTGEAIEQVKGLAAQGHRLGDDHSYVLHRRFVSPHSSHIVDAN